MKKKNKKQAADEVTEKIDLIQLGEDELAEFLDEEKTDTIELEAKPEKAPKKKAKASAAKDNDTAEDNEEDAIKEEEEEEEEEEKKEVKAKTKEKKEIKAKPKTKKPAPKKKVEAAEEEVLEEDFPEDLFDELELTEAPDPVKEVKTQSKPETKKEEAKQEAKSEEPKKEEAKKEDKSQSVKSEPWEKMDEVSASITGNLEKVALLLQDLPDNYTAAVNNVAEKAQPPKMAAANKITFAASMIALVLSFLSLVFTQNIRHQVLNADSGEKYGTHAQAFPSDEVATRSDAYKRAQKRRYKKRRKRRR